ncbi:ECF transporter S component [Clostridium sp. UBA4548]|uniref:ECF transporter S component n=1 Tax=Clostridium sp. UBA4548 TaxID=1946361 RepID=UPI0025C04FD5|nr:ECF transporter S component [Clostridium sp. UBA4548]
MPKLQTKNLVITSMLLAVAIVIQFLGRNFPQINQFLVGPIINSILILTTILCGIKWGALTGVLTPILAWTVGQLLPPMAPFIPFIILGNIIYVILFNSVSKFKFGNYIGILLGSFGKYLFLSISASKLVTLFGVNIPGKVLAKLAIMMSTPQLITGITGGVFALILFALLSKRHAIHNDFNQ